MKGYASEIYETGNADAIRKLGGPVTLLSDYAVKRAEREHLRLQNERNNDFGDLGEVRPTRFGNVGLVAEAYVKRAYGCNLVLIWSELRRAAESDDKTAKTAIDDCKMQLDFFVAFFWLSLAPSSTSRRTCPKRQVTVPARLRVCALFWGHMTRRLHNWSYRDVTQFLKEHGFVHHGPYFGSHELWARLKDDGTPEREVEVNFTKGAYPVKTLKTMIYQSGINQDEWIEWATS